MSKIQKQIDRRNVIWKAASKQERAVLVAKDVLARLKSGKFSAHRGSWLVFQNEDLAENPRPVQECILGGEPCYGCAMGGLMMSLISWRNKVKFDALSPTQEGLLGIGLSEPGFALGSVFSPSQQKLIERTFEGGSGQFVHEWDGVNYRYENLDYLKRIDLTKLSSKVQENVKSLIFYKSYSDENDRLKAMMNNIVKNKGVFIP